MRSTDVDNGQKGVTLASSARLGAHARVETRVLRDIRRELRSSYPHIRPWRISKIARKAGLVKFPAGLLVPGSTALGGSGERVLVRLMLCTYFGRSWAPHALMSETFYQLAHPDLAASRVLGWLHYQVFGRLEGRSPHPFLAVRTLAIALPDVPHAELIDVYLGDPRRWVCSPSPYVDAELFVSSGPWDGREHPLLQIIEQHHNQPWVRTDLLQIDGTSDDHQGRQGEIAAAIVLLNVASNRHGVSAPVTRWPAGGVLSTISSGSCRIVPGAFIAHEGLVEELGNAVRGRSLDGSAFLLDKGVVMRRSGSSIAVDRLLMVSPGVSHVALTRTLRESRGSLAVCPASLGQAIALKVFFERSEVPEAAVLRWGHQAEVSFEEFIFLRSELPYIGYSSYRVLKGGGSLGRTVLVIPAEDSHRLRTDPRLRELLMSGARLCLVVDQDLGPWHRDLAEAERIVTDRSFAESLGLLVNSPKHGLWTLP
jgi:hypothetical protein